MRNAYRNLKEMASAIAAVFGLAALGVGFTLQAATPVGLAWLAPTLNAPVAPATVGTPVSGPLTYTIYEGPQGGPKTIVKAGVTGLAYSPVKPGSCYQVSATDKDGDEGLLSAEVCYRVPAAPSGLVIK
jgi:hypothetical protein